MLLNENIKPTGQLTIVLTNETGEVKQEFTVPNMVVQTGKNWNAARMVDASIPPQMSTMGIGYGLTAANVSDTTLVSQLALQSLSPVGGTVSVNTVTYASSFPAGVGTGAVTEAGIFNSASTMLCRTVFPVVNKGAADSMTVTWTIQFV